MSFNVRETLEKLDDIDKDYRYMACNDLLTKMAQDGFQLDADNLRNLARKLLTKISDSSSEVQGLVVRCLGQLTKFVNESLVDEMIESLCAHLEQKDGKFRDIATLGLKQVITELPSSSGLAKQIGKKLTPRIVKTASDDSVPEVQLDALDVLQEMLKKFGVHMVEHQEKMLQTLLGLLPSPRSIVRRRSIACIGFLSVTLSEKLLAELVKAIVAGIKAKGKSAILRAYVQTVATVGRTSGSRISKYVKEVAPLILAFVKDDEGVESEDDEELRENCFQALEAFVLRCPTDVAPFVMAVLDASLVYIKHDPNYAFDEEEAGAADDADYDDDENYGDEDDVSWKVRRASAKTLAALIASRGDLLPVVYEKAFPVLVSRFREREEKVQEDVFNTVMEVLHQTSLLIKHDTTARERLVAVVPAVVQASARQLKKKSHKTRAGVFNVLRELVSTLPGALQSLFASLVPGVVAALSDVKAASDMRLAALEFVLAAVTSHSATVVQPHIAALAPLAFSNSADGLAQLSAVALRLIGELVLVSRPEKGQPGAGYDYQSLVKPAFQAVLSRLKLLDVDPAIKESSITAMGIVLARYGDALQSELGTVLPVLMQRLTNEITRLTTVQALYRIAVSDVVVPIKPVLEETYKEMAQLLRKISHQIKQASLQALDALTARYGKEVPVPLHAAVLTEAAALVSDADLFLAQLALKLTVTTLRTVGGMPVVSDKVLPKALELVASPMLQGYNSAPLLDFFAEVVSNKSAGVSFAALTGALDKIVAARKADDVNAQTFSQVGKVTAVLVASAPSEQAATVKKLVETVRGGALPNKIAALLSLGELGRRVDLSSAEVQSTVMGALDSDSEEVKGAASYALGCVATGNLPSMLPLVLREIQSQPKKQYLLLQSLLTIVASAPTAASALRPHLGTIMDLLFANSASEADSVRNVVAECLGRLVFVGADVVIPALEARLASPKALERGVVVTAIKYMMVEQPQEFDAQLTAVMPKFLNCLNDPDLLVRRLALRTLNAVAHRKPGVVRPHLKQFLPALLNESRIKQELIREIQVGPHKFLQDDGLDNRKAAFEVMFTLLENSLDLIDFPPFLAQLASGLADNADIKALSQLMLEKLARLEPAAVLAALDSLVDALQKTITFVPKADAVSQDVERNEELVKGALRAVAALSRVPNADSSVKFTDLVQSVILKNDKLAPKYQEIVKEAGTQ